MAVHFDGGLRLRDQDAECLGLLSFIGRTKEIDFDTPKNELEHRGFIWDATPLVLAGIASQWPVLFSRRREWPNLG